MAEFLFYMLSHYTLHPAILPPLFIGVIASWARVAISFEDVHNQQEGSHHGHMNVKLQ